MRILISGTSRSGTCLLTEVVRGLDIVNFSKRVEDRKFFEYEKLPENYGTKLTTNYHTLEDLKRVMNKYQDLYLVFTLRHPIDVVLSKIRREQRKSDGGDREREDITSIGTVETAIFSIKDFYKKYKFIINHYPGRSHSVKLENLLLLPEITINKVSDFFQVKSTEKAFKFYEYDRNKYHHKRYKRQIDLSQIKLHERWDTIYEGFFKDRRDDVEYAKKELYFIIKGFGYEI